jgi:hypothetical protein
MNEETSELHYQLDGPYGQNGERSLSEENILHEVEEMWEDLECDREIDIYSKGDGSS